MRYFTQDTIYKYLVCEFNHWDFCLSGLVKLDESYFLCEYAMDIECLLRRSYVCYTLKPIEMTEEMLEYLADYKTKSPFWFHEDGKRYIEERGSDLPCGRKFSEKWPENPITTDSEPLGMDELYDLVGEDWLDKQLWEETPFK